MPMLQPATVLPTIPLLGTAELIACRLNDWCIEHASSGAARLLLNEDRTLLGHSLRELTGPEILESWIEAAGWAGINRGLTRLFDQRVSPRAGRLDVALHRQDQLLVVEFTERMGPRAEHDNVGYLHLFAGRMNVSDSGQSLATVLAAELRLAAGASRLAVLTESANAGLQLRCVDEIRSLPALSCPPPQGSLLTDGGALFNTPEPRVRLLIRPDQAPSTVSSAAEASPLDAQRLQMRGLCQRERDLLDWLGASCGFALVLGDAASGEVWIAVGQMPASTIPSCEQIAVIESMALMTSLRLRCD